MKKDTFTVRGYKGITHLAFEASDVPKLAEILGAQRLVNAVNTAEISHAWNSEFEAGLCEKAEAAGHVRVIVKDAEGKNTDRETNSEFLKRTKFVLDAAQAQALADSIAFPVPMEGRKAKVDKDAVERLQLAQALLEDASKLERFRKKIAYVNAEYDAKITWPDFNGETTEEEDAAALAEVIRLDRLVA
jgi:hypothetical protein